MSPPSSQLLKNKEDDSSAALNPNKKTNDKNENFDLIVFGLMGILTLIGFCILVYHINYFTKELKSLDLEYKFPEFSDFSIVIIFVPICMALKAIIQKSLFPLCLKLIDKASREDTENCETFAKKMATNIFKLLAHMSAAVIEYLIFSQLNYFPRELGGVGEMHTMFEPGYPKSYFHWKPQFFDTLYIACLSHYITDLIWLILINERQTDYLNMVVHHVCTILLIIFSYITNYSNIGCVILFIHDSADVLVYITRILIFTDVSLYLKSISSCTLFLIFSYTRLYVFGKLIMVIFYAITWEWNWVTKCLWWFLIFLYIMHINWAYIILRKLVIGLLSTKFHDGLILKKNKKE